MSIWRPGNILSWPLKNPIWNCPIKTRRATPCPHTSHPPPPASHLPLLPPRWVCAVFSPLRWSVGASVFPHSGLLTISLQVACIIRNSSAHLYLYLACQKLGGSSLPWLIFPPIREIETTLNIHAVFPCVTHRLTNLGARITVPVFQMGELTKANLFHRLLCGPERVNPGTL